MNIETAPVQSSVSAPVSTPAQAEAEALLAKCGEISALAEKIGPEGLMHVCAALGRGARMSKATRPDFARWVATVAALTYGNVNAGHILAAARHANNQADGEVFTLKAGTAGGNTSIAARLKSPAIVNLKMD